MIGNTIFRALLEDQHVDWGLVLYMIIGELTENVEKSKPTPYQFYLYKEQQVLLLEEVIAYEIGYNLIKHDCTPDLEPKQEHMAIEPGEK